MSQSVASERGLPGPRPRPPERAATATDTTAPVTATELLAGAAAGNAAAWDALVVRYTALLWSVTRAHRLGEADAGDVVQTTWLRLLENLGRIEDPERLPGWLVTTTRRECLRVLCRAGRELPTPVEDAVLEVPDERSPEPDLGLLTEERDAALWRCFGRLPERCQRLLRVLVASEPAAYAQVSDAMGMPIGSIGPTRMRCLDRLRALTRTAGYSFEPATGGGL